MKIVCPTCAALRRCALSSCHAVLRRGAGPGPGPAAPILLAQNLRAPQLSETVVTATRTEQPLSDLVADVSIVDRETIEASGAAGVSDLLARLPGVEITRNGGVGNASSVYVRGAEQRFTAVYIDGVRIDSQSTGGALWEQIPLAQIERIEVLRPRLPQSMARTPSVASFSFYAQRRRPGPAPYVGVGLATRARARSKRA